MISRNFQDKPLAVRHFSDDDFLQFKQLVQILSIILRQGKRQKPTRLDPPRPDVPLTYQGHQVQSDWSVWSMRFNVDRLIDR
ncbi:hypothetical protein T4B_623 [Trichinella pseudospiralis]|uniref:Uncharacterized protein n=1 Tax=Trichinella pseudospiralis TaxID=6337 RepID=A0A0V1IYI7_TRIPS|nr:hypothetical protein T4B_623 [Trichinella pseudospiralis]